MGEGSAAFSKFVINAKEDVETVKAAVAAAIPVAIAGSQASIITLAAAAAAGDSLGTSLAVASLTQYVEQVQALAASQKAAMDFGLSPVEPVEKKRNNQQ